MQSQTEGDQGLRSIAPVWHTCVVLALLAMFSGLTIYLRAGSASERIGNPTLYAIVIAFEWVLSALCLWHTDNVFVAYVARVLKKPRALLWDIPVALLLGGALLLITPVLVRVMGPKGWGSTQGMLPSNHIEMVVWILMAITAGICEETIFRGYLQQQISGWTGSVVVGIVLQGAIFGVCHLYQGWKKMALIIVWGWVFGLVVWLRKGLRANMIAHALLDIISIF